MKTNYLKILSFLILLSVGGQGAMSNANFITFSGPDKDSLDLDDTLHVRKHDHDSLDLDDTLHVRKHDHDSLDLDDTLHVRKHDHDSLDLDDTLHVRKHDVDSLDLDDTLHVRKPLKDSLHLKDPHHLQDSLDLDDTTHVKHHLKHVRSSIYPNPSSIGQASIKIDAPATKTFILNIYNSTGMVVYTHIVNGGITSLSMLPGGFYYYNLINSSGAKVSGGVIMVTP